MPSDIIDYCSGITVKATPEEVEAVQVFSKILVEDFLYPKGHIQTHPQWRVKARPSDKKKDYPVDIAVFSSAERKESEELIIVECKRKNRKDGRSQLEDYLRLCRARIGVWFNGAESLYLKKIEENGKVLFDEIPTIPKYGQRLEDIGLYYRKDLQATHNLKSIFRSIRNYLAANAVGITRDEVFAQQIINIIFCKIHDERFTKPEDQVKFRAGYQENPKNIVKRIKEDLFRQVKSQYNDVINQRDEIILDDKSLIYVVGALQPFCLIDSERDVLSDAFETFIGPSLKGGQGQFFTPRNVINLVLQLVNLNVKDSIIDPACGSGGFLVESLRTIWRLVEEQAKDFAWPDSETFAEKQKVAIKNIRGIDKDEFLSKVAKAYMAILGDGRGGVFCENSLELPSNWSAATQQDISLGKFDAVATNPPFGKKLKIDDSEILSKYNLGYAWSFDSETCTYLKTKRELEGQAPQILFIERCIELLKPGGRVGIIAPESMFCNPSHRYIIEYIRSVARIKAIVSLPEELFQPYTHAKTCAVLIEKIPTDKFIGHDIFMAIARWCGHDSRGLEIPNDDIPKIIDRYRKYLINGSLDYDHFGFIVNEAKIIDSIYLPKYYNPEITEHLDRLKATHSLVKFGELVESGLLSVKTGHEVGKLAYGTGCIPFIRTSDIANWEIKLDPKHGLSQEIYEKLKSKQDVRENDILMVRDGTYLVGTCALVTASDIQIVYQSHIYKIRSKNKEKIHPYLLLAILSSPIVKEQIYSKRFTQDIIDTLGARLYELILPIPKSDALKAEIISQVEEVIRFRTLAKQSAIKASITVAPTTHYDPESQHDFLTMTK